MARVGANHANDALATYDLTVLADAFYGHSYLHGDPLGSIRARSGAGTFLS